MQLLLHEKWKWNLSILFKLQVGIVSGETHFEMGKLYFLLAQDNLRIFVSISTKLFYCFWMYTLFV